MSSQPTNDKSRRAPLTEDMPTNGVNPTPTSVPIQERQQAATKSESKDSGRKVLQDDKPK